MCVSFFAYACIEPNRLAKSPEEVERLPHKISALLDLAIGSALFVIALWVCVTSFPCQLAYRIS